MRPIEQASASSDISPNDTAPSGMGLNDILFMLFRHKWMILVCALAGLVGAAAIFYLKGRDYESRAKLLVRYVLERSAIDQVDPQLKQSGPQSDTVINSEVEILTSLDLALQVAETEAVERLLAKSSVKEGKTAGVKSIVDGIKVDVRKGSNVITVAYRSRDPELARTVLDELVRLYLKKHLEVHRSTGAFSFVTDQTQQARARLALTQDELQKRKADVGISSLAESTASINARMTRSEDDLLLAETELAVQQARFKEMESLLAGGAARQMKAPTEDEAAASHQEAPAFRGTQGVVPQANTGKDETGPSAAPVESSEVERYKILVEQVAHLHKSELELLSKYTPESKLVKSARRQIESLELERSDLEKKFPGLLAAVPTITGAGPRPDIFSEKTNLAALEARVESIKAQLIAAREQGRRLAEIGPQIADLERKKEAEEANLRYMESGLDKARIDEALDPTKIPNISIVQKPSAGAKVTGETRKLVLGVAGGGLGLGIGLTLLIELLLNRSIRRPFELETRLRIPQLLSVPFFPGGSESSLRLKNAGSDGAQDPDSIRMTDARPNLAPWAPDHFIRKFSEEIRDRLILSFQLKDLTHKPKLVGVAGLSGGEGVSTLAGGLAAALSETGGGKVLLVDMNSRSSDAHPFRDGKPACGLAAALEANGSLPAAADNLYLATGTSEKGGLMQLAAKQFYALVPDLKASHFDYIIFDLPPVSRGSATLAIAGCLDKLLFVVEAEKSDRDQVKRAYAGLVAANADVSGILNKMRTCGPKWINS